MAKRLQYRRLLLLGILLSVAFGGLAYRLVDLQVLCHQEWSVRALQNTQHEYLLQPRRGDILDVKGNPLATSVYVKTVCADPVLIGTHQAEVAHALAPLLQSNEAKLAQSLSLRALPPVGSPGFSLPGVEGGGAGQAKAWTTNRYVRYVVLKQKVPVETWDKIHATMTNLTFGIEEKTLTRAQRAFYRELRQKAIFARDDQLRVYPNQSLAAHVLGYATTEEREVGDTPVREILGRDGIETDFE